MTEQDVQRKVLSVLKSFNAYCFKTINTNRAGVPDIIACYKGTFIAIEVKKYTTRNNVSALQKVNLKAIEEAGGIAIVIHEQNLDFLKIILEEL